MELTMEELASGDWVWDEDLGDFININDPEPEEKKEEKPIPTHAITGMHWNGNKLS